MAEYRVTLTFSSSDPLHRDRVAIWLAFLIAGLALVVRFYQLGSEPIWIDEAVTNYIAHQPLAALWNPKGEADLTPPLWYTIQKVWLVFGESESALRSAAALAGVLAIPVVFAIGKFVAGNRAGLLASLLLATSVVHVHFSQEARAYALLFLSAAIVLWGLLYLLADPQRAMTAFSNRPIADETRSRARLAWAAYGVGAAAGLYSHNTIVFLLAWANVCWLIVWLRSGCPRNFFLAWAGINTAVAASFAWWLPIVIHQSVTTLASGGGVGNFGKRYTSWPALIDVISSDYGGQQLAGASLEMTVVVLLLAGFGVWRLRRNLTMVLVLAGAVVFVPVATALFSLWRPILSDSVLVWPVAALVVLQAIGALGLPRRMAVLVCAALIGVNSIGLANYFQEEVKPDWRQTAVILGSSIRAGDAIVLWSHWQRLPFDYYFKKEQNSIRPEILGIAALKPGDTGPLQIWERNRKLVDLTELGQKFARIWLIVTWPQNKDDARIRFQQIGNVREVQRIGDIGIFQVDSNKSTSK